MPSLADKLLGIDETTPDDYVRRAVVQGMIDSVRGRSYVPDARVEMRGTGRDESRDDSPIRARPFYFALDVLAAPASAIVHGLTKAGKLLAGPFVEMDKAMDRDVWGEAAPRGGDPNKAGAELSALVGGASPALRAPRGAFRAGALLDDKAGGGGVASPGLLPLRPKEIPVSDEIGRLKKTAMSEAKPLFEYDALADPPIPIGRSHDFTPNLAEYARTVPDHIKGMRSASRKENLRDLRDDRPVVSESGDRTNLWYNSNPLIRDFQRIWGDHWEEQLGKFIDLNAGSSPLSEVSPQTARATEFWRRYVQGEPITTPLPSPYGGPAQKLHIENALKVALGEPLVNAKGDPSKVTNYALNMRGVTGRDAAGEIIRDEKGRPIPSPVTIDTWMNRIMGLRGRDKDRATTPTVPGPAYGYMSRVVRDLGNEVGMTGNEAQADIWQAFLRRMGGYGDVNDPWTRILEDRIRREAQRRGISAEKMRDMVIAGEGSIRSELGLPLDPEGNDKRPRNGLLPNNVE